MWLFYSSQWGETKTQNVNPIRQSQEVPETYKTQKAIEAVTSFWGEEIQAKLPTNQ